MRLCLLHFVPTFFGVQLIMGDLVVVGTCVGFTVSTCSYMIGWAIAQVRRLIRSIR